MQSRALAILVCAALLDACHALQQFIASRASLQRGCLVETIQWVGTAISWLLDVLMSGFGRAGRCANVAVPVFPAGRSCVTEEAPASPSATSCQEDT
jgi:hypothetical protein